ncbi:MULTISPECIES: glucose-6-phosphate isomerase family protein [Sinorhizobium]|uniref:glucose-6-phosphate isomerase family protein n=1 Tax=Sinorhizobium TaxID=28105 RepID=UPI0004BCB18E|nr:MULTISPECIES: glucose-6-phosphate isomerase family protein [Sinorhizobium]ASY60656.1 Glucose-6-phosphate isomerase, archaeal [Sinorhizobium sp. CCBAU 05631]ASY74170.1 Glucose-6-phosphate isomerase, archaeal [Sinorhizobium fredii CCBAU 83666]
MIIPENVLIDAVTGTVATETERYEKRVSDLRQVFADREAVERMVAEKGNPLVYQVRAYRKEGCDLWFGTTTIEPGRVGSEYFMTRGHFHKRRDMGEVYYTQAGNGLLLLQSRDSQIETLEMRPGVCSSIPPDWAHRSINVGDEPLVFFWICNVEAGNDYADIVQKGMLKRVVVGNSGPQLIVNRS